MRLNLGSAEVVDRRYIMNRQLGKGGMGAVYEAYDRLMGETVALKLVTAPPPDLDFASRAGGLNLYLALAQEFKVLATLRHPNIISVISYGFDEQQRPYFTMDLLDNAQSPARAVWGQGDDAKVRVLIQILQALSYLHRRGVIHRDLKPANVRMMNGQARVLDFGLSIIKDQDKIDSDRIVGTIEYMAPELLRQHPPSIESDLYAVGVLGYELFTGEYLFDSSDIRSLAQQIFHKIPDPSSVGNPPVAAVLSRLLAKDPAERYHSADEVIHAFAAAVNQAAPEETAAIRESYLQAANLVGRDAELKELMAAFDQAHSGLGNGYMVGGESGVGKSRLLDELRIRALVKGAVVLRGEAMQQGRSPYQIWREPLRMLALTGEVDRKEAGILQTIIPDIDKLLEIKVIVPEELDPQATQRRLAEVVLELFRRQKRPMLLMLEDVHWAGLESVSLLHQLTQLAPELPLMILISYRDDESPDLPDVFPNLPLMRLRRLDENAIEQLVVEMLGEKGRSQDLMRLLKKETEGNIFFLVEVIRALAEEVGRLEDISSMQLPRHVFTGGVEKIILRRLNRVPLPVRPMLEIAAVNGRYLDLKILNFLINDPQQLEEWLTIASNAAVLEIQDGNWRFAHEKLREVMLFNLPKDIRQDRHRLVAEAIENVYLHSPEHFTSLAYHWAVTQNTEKEFHYASLAGEQVLKNGSYNEAVVYLSRALELMPQKPDIEIAKRQANLTRQLGAAYQGLGKNNNAKQLYADSLKIYQDVDYKWGIAFALSDLGHACYGLQEFEDSYRYFREAIQTAMSVRAQTVALAAIVGIAKLMYAAKRYQWAIELVSFTKDHVAVDRQTALRAEELLAQLEPIVAPDVFMAAVQRGQEKKISEVVEELL